MEKKLNYSFKMGELNYNDTLLISIALKEPISITELSKKMGIAPKNIILRLPKLEELNWIKINRQGKGKKTLISVNKDNPNFDLIKTISDFSDKFNGLDRDKQIATIKKSIELTNKNPIVKTTITKKGKEN